MDPDGEHEGREDIENRWKMFLQKRLPPGVTDYPWDAYWKGVSHAQGMRQYSLALGQTVQEGDVLSFGGGALGSWAVLGAGNIGGRTRDMVIHPTNPNIMLAAGDSGGIFRSTDAGASWAAVAGELPILHLSDLAIDPNAPDTVYAASGDVTYSIKGAGIYRSTDAGATWTTLGATLPGPTNSSFDLVARVVVSKNNSQRLYAATNAGIMRSTNGGTSWANVYGGHTCHDLEIRTDVTTDHVVAACGSGFGLDSQIVVNTDAGGTGAWTVRYSDPTDAGVNTSTNIQIAIAPSQQSTMYASLVNNNTAGTLSIRRSTNGGTTWTQVSTSNLLGYCGPNGAYGDAGFGWIFNAIKVDPLNPNVVWLGGVFMFRSDDGGATWGKVAHSNTFTHPTRYSHVDNSSIVFHPQYNGGTNKTAFLTNDGGIFKTTDALAATDTKGICRDDDNFVGQIPWVSLNNSFASNQFVYGAVYSDGSGYFGGTWDNGTLWGKNSLGVNGWFSRWFNGDGGFVAVDPKNSQIQFTFGPIEGHGKIVKTTNEGLGWNDIAGGNTSGLGFAPERDADNDTPFVVDPNSCVGASCNRWWTAGFSAWRSADGVAFTQASTPANTRITAIGVAPTNPNRVLNGTDAGDILFTNVATNATSSTVWTTAPQPRFGRVSSIAFDPSNHNVAYAAYSTFDFGANLGHLFKTTNGGANWTRSDGSGMAGIPDVPIHQVVVNPYDTKRVYVGTEIGVFISDDAGATWAAETGNGHVVVHRLEFVKSTSELYAFTWGRGLRKVADPNTNPPSYAQVTPAAGLVTASANDGNVPGNTVDNNLGTRWAANGDGQWIKFDLGSNRSVGHVSLAVYQGDTRKNKFDLQVSTDNTNWTTVWSGTSSGATLAQQTYDFPDVTARYVRYLGHGNVTNAGVNGTWNSVTEVDIFAAPQGGMAPPAPTGLVATAGNAQVMLSWNASSGASGYNVKRGTTSGGPYTTIGSPTVTRFVDTTAANGAPFFYVVTATNPIESSNSAQASATASAATCKTATGGATGSGSWINTAFASQAGSFTAEYDATPSAVLDSTVTMSKGAQTAFTGFATLTRFNPSSNIDARNGSAYAANVTLPYSGGSNYHFRLAVNVPAHTYSIFVTPPGGAEQTIGTNFAFRTEQNAVTSLDNWGVQVNKAGTSFTDKVCNFWVHP